MKRSPNATARDAYDRAAPDRLRWRAKNAYFYDEELRFLRYAVPPGRRVLELGCGVGDLLAGLSPSYGVGVDISAGMIAIARDRHPRLAFHIADVDDEPAIESLGGPFDFIIATDLLGGLRDCEQTLARLHDLLDPDGRLIIAIHSPLWAPILRIAEAIGRKMPTPAQNWLWRGDLAALLDLADFATVTERSRILLPLRCLGVGRLVNQFVTTVPGARLFCLRHYAIERSTRRPPAAAPSVSVVIPCRNERGNIAAAVERMPSICPDLELIFVEGHSSDGTWEEVRRVRDAHRDRRIVIAQQPGRGKGDAVRAGFALATGDILMILDADLTTPPEDLPKFYRAIVADKGQFVMGSRLVYAMEDGAMQFLNYWANRVFALLFSWLLDQRITDTLCGTKVLWRRDYERIAADRGYFGEFDPFGDFDLIFGAAKRHLKIVEVPVRYAARSYGATNISRFSHGWLLLRMVAFAYRKIKAL